MPITIPNNTYTNLFAGTPVNPSTISYEAISLTGDITLSWPITGLETNNVVSTIIDVQPSALNFTITMPDSTQVSVGQSVLFRNTSEFAFTIMNFDGSLEIATVADSSAVFIYLTDTSTANGEWAVVAFGATTAAAQASELAGRGLKSISNTLNLNTLTTVISSPAYVITPNDRASLLVWNGGSGTITFPNFSTLGNGWLVAISNQDSNGGQVVLVPTTGTIDKEETLTLALGQTAFFVTDGSDLYSIGLGNLIFFNASMLSKNIGGVGPTVTISSLEATNLIQTYTGTLLEDVTVVYPDTVAEYIIANLTSGSFDVNVTLDGSLTSVLVPAAERLFFYSDGTNLYSIPTTIPASSIIFPDGSEGSPSVTFEGDTGSGMYLPVAGNINITTGSVDCVNFSSSGITIIEDGSISTPSLAWFNLANSGLYPDTVNDLIKISVNSTDSFSIGEGQALLEDGLVTAPSLALNSDPTTGFYTPGAGRLAFTSAGVLKTTLTENGLLTIDGSNTTPAYSYASESGLGLFRSSSGILGISSTGATVTTFGPTTVAVKSNASATLPDISFIGDTGTGIGKPIANTLALFASGAVHLAVDNAKIQTDLVYMAPNASAANPAYTFTGNTNTGLYATAGQLYISAAGTSSAVFISTGMTLPNGNILRLYDTTQTFNVSLSAASATSDAPYILPYPVPTVSGQTLICTTGGLMSWATSSFDANGIKVPDGDVNNPSISFTNSPTTGIYSPAGTQVGITCDGQQVVNFQSSQIDFNTSVVLDFENKLIFQDSSNASGIDVGAPTTVATAYSVIWPDSPPTNPTGDTLRATVVGTVVTLSWAP